MVDSYAVREPSNGRSGGVPLLSPSVMSALQSWLDERHRAHASAPVSLAAVRGDGTTRRAMRQLCDEAHRHGMRAEQVIVLLKQLWAALPASPGPEDRHASRGLLDGIVSVCIEEFYASAGSAGSDVSAAHVAPDAAAPSAVPDGSSVGR